MVVSGALLFFGQFKRGGFGALTAKPYAFIARPWELEQRLSFDFTDSELGPLIFFFRGTDLIRVLPAALNGESEWISDRARFFFDGLRSQRLDSPLVRILGESGGRSPFYPIGWFTAFSYFKLFVDSAFVPNSFLVSRGFLGPSVGVRSLTLDFANGFSSVGDVVSFKRFISQVVGYRHYFNSLGAPKLVNDFRFLYLCFDDAFSECFSLAGRSSFDFFFFFFNPRLEHPLLNSRIRRDVVSGKSSILIFGSPVCYYNYKVYDLGYQSFSLLSFFSGRSKFCRYFNIFDRTLITLNAFVPASCLGSQPLITSFFTFLRRLNLFGEFPVYSLFQSSPFLAENELGVSNSFDVRRNSSVLYIFESNEIEVLPAESFSHYSLIVYHGFQAESSMRFADLVFPLRSLYERDFCALDFTGRLVVQEPVDTHANARFGSRSVSNVFERLADFLCGCGAPEKRGDSIAFDSFKAVGSLWRSVFRGFIGVLSPSYVSILNLLPDALSFYESGSPSYSMLREFAFLNGLASLRKDFLVISNRAVSSELVGSSLDFDFRTFFCTLLSPIIWASFSLYRLAGLASNSLRSQRFESLARLLLFNKLSRRPWRFFVRPFRRLFPASLLVFGHPGSLAAAHSRSLCGFGYGKDGFSLEGIPSFSAFIGFSSFRLFKHLKTFVTGLFFGVLVEGTNYTEKQFSSVIRFSKPLVLKQRYFDRSNYNFTRQ